MAKKDIEAIEVKEAKIVNEKVKATPKKDVGTDKKGNPKFKAGVEYSFTKEQIKILTNNKDI